MSKLVCQMYKVTPSQRAAAPEQCQRFDEIRVARDIVRRERNYLLTDKCKMPEDEKTAKAEQYSSEFKALEDQLRVLHAAIIAARMQRVIEGVDDAWTAHESAGTLGEQAARKEELARKNMAQAAKLRERETAQRGEAAKVFPLIANHILESDAQEDEKQEEVPIDSGGASSAAPAREEQVAIPDAADLSRSSTDV